MTISGKEAELHPIAEPTVKGPASEWISEMPNTAGRMGQGQEWDLQDQKVRGITRGENMSPTLSQSKLTNSRDKFKSTS